MEFIYRKLLLLLIVLQIASVYNGFAAAANSSTRLHAQEVKELKIIARKLGKTDWELGIDQCSSSSSNGRQDIFVDENNSITCDCSSSSITNLNSSSQSDCHVVSIAWKSQNLSGTLPPEFAKLHYLRNLDLSRNYLSGSIPPQWATMCLRELSLMSNQLSGPFPKVLTSITSLTNLSIEGNSFSGRIPPEIGKLINLQKLILSSNAFTGNLPEQLAKLTNLTDMRINDNNFTGKIPDFISHWKLIQKLHIQGCSLEGPIPSSISTLTRLTDLRISDLKGRESSFPSLRKMDSIKTLTLRRCLLYGEIPMYIADMTKLKNLDLSFNNLSGEIPAKFIQLAKVDFMYLTGNKLTGTIPRWILGMIKIVDISYNNFTWESSGPIECPRGSVNLVESYSSSAGNSSRLHSCLKQNFPCSASSNQYRYSFHINCGGKEINVNGTKYIADIEQRGASMFYSGQNWAFSSTGNFMDNNVYSDVYTETNTSSLANVSAASLELYKTARASPLSLTYYGLCLGNGNYTVKLHFAEIIFTNDSTFNSLGRRIFDVYIQGKLVLKDFNIRAEAGGTGIPVVKAFTTAVTSHTLKIHFYWAGKGTTGIPDRGFYGPLVSAISVNPNFKPPVIHSRKINVTVVVGAVATSLLLVLLALLIMQRKGWLGSKVSSDKELRGIDLQTGLYSLRQMKAATNNFDAKNKVGEGGFGAVYKGSLSNGTVIAVKQLSSKSRQGNREFINEIGMISAFQHPNLVKLYGCCVEGNQLMVVYEYLENNCLSRALFGKDAVQRLKLDWATRRKICLGIARGLAYLHEESTIKIVHRDIKTSNVLLDKNMNAKISDFGLAKLYEDDKSHISTRIAGTIGYMAPEYAMRGHLTNKADVYSFGVVALEIVSGKSNTSYRPNEEFIYLLDWAYVLQERGSLLELVDPNLGKEYPTEETILTLNVALMCTNASPTLRPTMSQVVSMLEGQTAVQDLLSDPGFLAINSKVKAIRNHFWQNPNQTQSFSSMGNDSKSSFRNEGSHLLRASSVQSKSNDEKEID